MKPRRAQRAQTAPAETTYCRWCDASPLRLKVARHRWGGKSVRACSICRGPA